MNGKKGKKANCTVKKGREGYVCVCCPSNLSMNSLAGIFPNRARSPTDRMKDGVTEQRERERANVEM